MEHLNALASICESAERMPIISKPYTSGTPLVGGSFGPQYPTATANSNYLQRQYYAPSLSLVCATPTQYNPSMTIQSSSHQTPVSCNGEQTSSLSDQTEKMQTGATPNVHSSFGNIPTDIHCSSRPINPVMRNIISYASYLQYLDETWPEKCSRRGSAVIRASLYAQIADCLKGGASTARFRYWVRKSGFFLLEKQQNNGVYDTCIAVPLHTKQQNCSSGNNKKAVAVKQYRLVAKLEDFLPLIGEYHNDVIGHYGIRKTYQMIQQDYTYLPRSAIAKFVQLCDVCSVRGKRVRHEEACCITETQIMLADREESEEKEEDESRTSHRASKSIHILPSAPSPEGEIEITTEASISGSSSLQIESNPQIPPSAPLEDIEKVKGTTQKRKEARGEGGIMESLPLSQSEPNQIQHAVPSCNSTISEPGVGGERRREGGREDEGGRDPSSDLYHQIHESVRHLLEGLTWEEMIQLYTETTDNAIIASPNTLESVLRLQ